MTNNNLKHVAIIMDGNRRWAKKHNKSVEAGHKKGAENIELIVDALANEGVGFVTLFAFSTENWGREKKEVDGLMSLLRHYLKEDVKKLADKGVKILFIGERYMLDDDIVKEMQKIESNTVNNDKITVCIALSYGSRHEIINATKKIAKLVKKDELAIEDIDFNVFSNALYTSNVPDPDILIRTSGERRISNYLLWQLAYAELFFTDTLWPDFGSQELLSIISLFNLRERRYGKS
ncbi:MAG: polyprenyl diphosphate synthase [Alphaproteobacteria bacterium]